jgi:hypothetical protein
LSSSSIDAWTRPNPSNGSQAICLLKCAEESDDAPKLERGERGRWKKGSKSPNPGGYTKAQHAARKDVREAAKRLTPLALKTLQRIMENPKAPASAKAQAAALALDRAWGKMPVMAVVDEQRQITVRWLGDDDPVSVLAIDHKWDEGL